MNLVVISGRLTKDPEITQNGEIKIARYTLAVRRSFKSQQQADFINCTAFGRTAENAEKYYKKGMLINATGRIQTGSYTNKEGKKVYTTDVVISEQEFGESKKSSEEHQAHQEQTAESSSPAAVEEPKEEQKDDFMDVGTSNFDDDEVPFA